MRFVEFGHLIMHWKIRGSEWIPTPTNIRLEIGSPPGVRVGEQIYQDCGGTAPIFGITVGGRLHGTCRCQTAVA